MTHDEIVTKRSEILNEITVYRTQGGSIFNQIPDMVTRAEILQDALDRVIEENEGRKVIIRDTPRKLKADNERIRAILSPDRELPVDKDLTLEESRILFRWAEEQGFTMTNQTIAYCLAKFNKHKGQPITK